MTARRWAPLVLTFLGVVIAALLIAVALSPRLITAYTRGVTDTARGAADAVAGAFPRGDSEEPTPIVTAATQLPASSPAAVGDTPGARPAPGQEGTYTIQAGDSPAAVAEKFGIPVERLLEANNITDPNSLQAGQVLVIPTPADSTTSTPAAGGDALRIGLLLDYTGALAEFGPNMETGAQLAVKQINASGGVLGKPVQLVVGDSGTNPNVAVAATNRLVASEGVSAIIGSLASGVTIAAAEGVAVPNKIVMISPSSTSPALTAVKDDDFLFRTVLSDAAQGKVLADWAIEQGYKTAATFYIDNAYGEGLSAQFVQSFQEKGGTITAAVSHESGWASYLSGLQKATEGHPDVLAAISYPSDASVYLKEALDNNLIDKFLFVDGTKSMDIIRTVGAAALEGTTGTSPVTFEKAELTTQFDAEYAAEYGTDVPSLPYVRETYDSVVLIALAAEAAGSTDPTKIRDQLRKVAGPPGQKLGASAEGVSQALQAVRAGTDIDFEGSANADNFDENGDVLTGAIEIFRIVGGSFQTVKIVPVSFESS